MTEQNIFHFNCSPEILKPFQFCVGSSRGDCETLHEMTHLLYLYFIAEGKGEVVTKQEKREVSQGDIIYVFPGNHCSFSFYGQQNKWYWISMEIGNNVEFSRWNQMKREIVILNSGITSKISKILSQLEKRQGVAKESPYAILGIVYTLMDEISKEPQNDEVQKLGGKDRQSVAVAAEYIAINYYHKIDVDSICRYVNYSRYYFSRCFKEIQGMSIMEYINKVRLDRAIYLLNHTDLTVIEVAKSVGFDDPYYFSKKFKAYTGVPPSRFKNTFQ